MNSLIVIPYNQEAYTIEYQDKVMDYNELRYVLAHLPHPYSWFEIVHVNVMGVDCLMYLNEEGKMCDPDLWLQCTNYPATMLYDNPFDCIVGDVVLFADHHDPETYLFNEEETAILMKYFKPILKQKRK